MTDIVSETRQSKQQRAQKLADAHREAGLTPEQWRAFELDFDGDVDAILRSAVKEADALVKSLSGTPVVQPPPGQQAPNSYLQANTELDSHPLSLLDAEALRLRRLIGIDAENAKTLTRLSEKISKDESELARFDREIAVAKSASDRMTSLNASRLDSYAAIFDAIVEEEAELGGLYEPLRAVLEAEDGTLGKLSFSVKRLVNLLAWASEGEKLLDLRKGGAFKGHGALAEAAKKHLVAAWETGSSKDVAAAMASFRRENDEHFQAHYPGDRKDAKALANWLNQFSSWLYSTDHIGIAYGVKYDGVDIEQLSSGTRGIVLLMLYLVIDRDDDRPLIIDQPEENLDPKSVFDDLVDRFRIAKRRRQIIVVTHNANLVVNTDADQVIVASCGPHRPGNLPNITYESGGLENPEIRRRVCEILEGGEQAFRERAKRLRVRIS